MTHSTSSRSRGQSYDYSGLIPVEEIFLPPGEQAAVELGPPLTPDERFRERVAVAWAWVKAVRFQEHEHKRLCEALLRHLHAEMESQEI